MPYIQKVRRDYLDPKIEALGDLMQSEGEMNYIFTKLALRHLDRHGTSYRTLNEAHGTFFSAAAEFYRRVFAPYENRKVQDNGDVYY